MKPQIENLTTLVVPEVYPAPYSWLTIVMNEQSRQTLSLGSLDDSRSL